MATGIDYLIVPAAAAPAPVTSVFGRVGAVVADTGDYTVAQVTGAAPLDSPAFTGIPTAPTASPLTNDPQLATTAYVDAAVAAGAVPSTSIPIVVGSTSGAVGTSLDYARADHIHELQMVSVTPDTYGSSTQVAVVTVDAFGRVTSALSETIGTVPVTDTSSSIAVGWGGALLVSTLSGAVTITLPSGTTYANNPLYIKKISTDANALTIVPAAGGNIDGQTSVVITIPDTALMFVSDGSTTISIL